jgi:hypothetical protein
MSGMIPNNVSETIEEVQMRASVDRTFRALALADPEAAIAQVNSRFSPESSIVFIESLDIRSTNKDENVQVIVLTPLAANSDELSDELLEEVAGGTNTNPPPPPPVGLS